MKRRRFLGAILGAIGAGAAVTEAVGQSPKQGAKVKVKPSVNQGKIRELVAYDISEDRWIARWDIFAGGEQHLVDAECRLSDAAKHGWDCYEKWLAVVRPAARDALDGWLRDKGLTFTNCMMLPFPAGVMHAKYV